MEMVLRASAARVDRQRYRVIGNRRAVALAHDLTPLPGLPEEVRRQRVQQQRAFGAVNAVGRHQQILQRAVTIFKQHIAALEVHFGARRRVLLLLLMGDALLQNNLAQRVRVARVQPVVAARQRREDRHQQRQQKVSYSSHFHSLLSLKRKSSVI